MMEDINQESLDTVINKMSMVLTLPQEKFTDTNIMHIMESNNPIFAIKSEMAYMLESVLEKVEEEVPEGSVSKAARNTLDAIKNMEDALTKLAKKYKIEGNKANYKKTMEKIDKLQFYKKQVKHIKSGTRGTLITLVIVIIKFCLFALAIAALTYAGAFGIAYAVSLGMNPITGLAAMKVGSLVMLALGWVNIINSISNFVRYISTKNQLELAKGDADTAAKTMMADIVTKAKELAKKE
jgi:hypothetical protein